MTGQCYYCSAELCTHCCRADCTCSCRKTTKWGFATTEERDRFLDAYFPRRECLDTPGCYRLPNGATLSVFANEVTRFPLPRKEKP